MKNIFKVLLACCFVFTPAIHCGGSVVPNPGTEVSLRVVGVGPTSTARLATRAQTNSFNISEARLVLGEIKFRSASACGESSLVDDQEIHFEGPYVVNLLNDESFPSIDSVEIPAGDYCRLELKIERLHDDEVPAGVGFSDEIVDHTFVVRGARADGVAFEAFGRLDQEFKIGNSGFAIDPSQDGLRNFIVAFNFGDWFSGIDLNAAEVNSGLITIDEDQNEVLLEQLESNIKQSAELYRDLEGDGELDEADEEELLGQGED